MKSFILKISLAIIVGCLAMAGALALSSCSTSAAPGTLVDQDLLSFAQTVQNVIQTVNSGVKIIAPAVNSAASLAQLVAQTPQQKAILSKITAISANVSAAAVASGAPPAVVQAAVSGVNTPDAAIAIVQQVQASRP